MLTEEQKQIRKTGIGGSDAAAICGLNKYCTPLQVYLEKTEDVTDKEDNHFMYWGRAMEPVLLEEYQRLTGHVVTTTDTLRSQEYPWMIANLDGYVEAEGIVVEVKNVSAYRAKEFGEQFTDEVPTEYLMQMAHYAIVANAKRVDLAVLIGGNDFRVYSYKRNDILEEQLIRIESNFWNENVLKKIPPEPKTYEEAMQMWPAKVEGAKVSSVVVSNEKVSAALDEIKMLQENIKELKEQESKRKAEICFLLEDGEILMSPDGAKLATWKTQDSTRFSISDFKEAYPDLVREFTKAIKSRVLRIH